jgi:glycosyltransferase involved in cell wall biosynthesis
VKIAYLVNCYPAVSHSFIRREIAAIEEAGGTIFRYSVRPSDLAALPDARDQLEYDKTTVILSQPWLHLLLCLIGKMVRSPISFYQAVRIAFAHSSFRPSDLVRRVAYLAEASWLTRRLIENEIAHLHTHFGTNSAMVARLSRKLGGPPYSFTVHGPDEFDRPVEIDLKGKVADSAFCVAISSFGRGQLMRWSELSDWKKIEVVRCGVDDDFIAKHQSKSVTDDPRFCAVARLSGQKGIPLLVEAASELKKEGHRFTIDLIGDGEMRNQIEEMISRYDVHDTVIIKGWSSSGEIVEHLLNAKAMVLPSFAEGLPVVIMEALALERPVIVTAIAGTPELVNNDCGWLIPSGSVDALVDAMRSALQSSSQELSAMGIIGRQRILEFHNSNSNGAYLYSLIQRFNSSHA